VGVSDGSDAGENEAGDAEGDGAAEGDGSEMDGPTDCGDSASDSGGGAGGRA
jgi:hypothetical protein